MEKAWTFDSEWLNPIYWIYVVANYFWTTLWCALLPETCA